MTRNSRHLTFVAATVAGLLASPAALAQEKYLGEIMLVGYNFCPRGTASAEGQLLPISSNTALFSLYGTMYGGDGRTTFALPDLRGRAPIGQGNGPGLNSVREGQRGGAESSALSVANLPNHSHTLRGQSGNGDTDSPDGAVSAKKPRTNVYSSAGANANMGGTAIGSTGGGVPFDIRGPYLGMRYCVVLTGIFPSRS